MTQTTVVEHKLVDRLDQFVKALAMYPPDTQLQTAATVLDHAADLARLSKNSAEVIKPAARLFYDFAHLPPPAVPSFRELFNGGAITQLLVGRPDYARAQILLRSLRIFLAVLDLDPAAATVDLFTAIVSDELKTPIVPPGPPALLQEAHVLLGFKPAVHSDAVISSSSVYPVSVVSELPNSNGLGPELYGLAYTHGDVCHVLLATGEYVTFPANSIQVAACPPAVWKDLPAYLLACGAVFFPRLLPEIASPGPVSALINTPPDAQTFFGAFLQPPVLKNVAAAALSGLTAVLDYAPIGPTGPVTANTEFELNAAGHDYRISLGAQYCAPRCRIASNVNIIVGGTSHILMRLPPRELSAKGVYLFPLEQTFVGLIVL